MDRPGAPVTQPAACRRDAMDAGPVDVMHVVTGLDIGGAEHQLTLLAEANIRAGRRVRVVSLLAGGDYRARLEHAGVAITDLGMRRGRPSLTALTRLIGLIRRQRPKVLQSWLYHADLYATTALLLSGRRRRTRLLWCVRCSDMDATRYGAPLRLVMGLCAALSRVPDAIIANAVAGRDAHRQRGYRARSFPVIANGIDTDIFRPDPVARAAVRAQLGIDATVPVLVHVARVDPMKDHATYLAALDRMPNIIGLAIGDNTRNLPDHPRLRRLGARTDVARLMAAGDVIVSSSAFGEGFSNAIAEGMATGLPAVATDVGDTAMIVGDCGRVVAPGDPVALADAVTALLGDDPAALGARARHRIKAQFGIAAMVAAYDEIATV